MMKLNGKPIDKLLVADLKEELAKRDLPKHGKNTVQAKLEKGTTKFSMNSDSGVL